MKKLVILAVMTACVMSLAQTQDLVIKSIGANQIPQIPVVVEFKHGISQNKVTIFDRNAASELFREAMKKRIQDCVEKNKGRSDFKIGMCDFGWQPEFSESVKVLNGYIHLISSSLGNQCDANVLVNQLQQIPLPELNQDTLIDIDQLSPSSQECLRK